MNTLFFHGGLRAWRSLTAGLDSFRPWAALPELASPSPRSCFRIACGWLKPRPDRRVTPEGRKLSSMI